MARIFLLLALLALTACSRQQVNEVTLPADVAAVTTPFLAAVKRGDQVAAEKLVAPTFVDDSKLQFAKMSALLGKSPALKPAIYRQKPGTIIADENEVSIIFVAKDGEKWISSQIRLYRPENETFEVEYWDVTVAKKPPALVSHAQQMQRFMAWLMAGMAVMALLGLALLIWVVKRRTHIIAPEPVIDTRRVATTVRDGDV